MKELEYPFDNEFILSRQKKLKRKLLENAEDQNFISKKIAILGGSTTNRITQILELFLLNFGIKPEFYESDYNRYWEEAVLPNDRLDAFAPDIVYIHTTVHNIIAWPDMNSTKQDTEELLQKEYQHYLEIWESLRSKYHCAIIQNNFEYMPYRLFGNADSSIYKGGTNFIMKLNLKFADYAEVTDNFYIHDINYLSADYGLTDWHDLSAWYMYKYAFALEAVPKFSYSIALIIKSLYGKNKKALVLDLDNTLWGGTIGDDGVEAIGLGPETAIGQAYLDVQRYIKALSGMGVVLSVNSKNDPENAKAGIEHPDSCLKMEDFAVVKANWASKADNMKEIVQELNLLPESLVFLDDNPAEREMVHTVFPQIAVPALENVEQYICMIDHAGFFEVTSLSDEDAKRTQMYKENSMRNSLASEYVDYEDYLRALKMRSRIQKITDADLTRVTQLVNKTNQFNFTTKRYEQNEIKAIAEDPGYITLCGRLEDKFGDNGIVSVIIGRKEDKILHIELWIMSCRVFKRNMEFAMLDELVMKCRKAGVQKITGYYYPTNKNANIKMQYGIFGFEKAGEDSDGNSVWQYNIPDDYTAKNNVIEVEGDK